MLKRKIEDTLLQWKNTSGHKPLVIMGIRQYGKTFIDLEPEDVVLEPIDTDELTRLAREILGKLHVCQIASIHKMGAGFFCEANA